MLGQVVAPHEPLGALHAHKLLLSWKIQSNSSSSHISSVISETAELLMEVELLTYTINTPQGSALLPITNNLGWESTAFQDSSRKLGQIIPNDYVVNIKSTCVFKFFNILEKGSCGGLKDIRTSGSSQRSPVSTHPCVSSGVSGARRSWWISSRRTSSCRQRVALRCASGGGLAGETSFRTPCHSQRCGICAASSSPFPNLCEAEEIERWASMDSVNVNSQVSVSVPSAWLFAVGAGAGHPA